jgi:hypothetical protein
LAANVHFAKTSNKNACSFTAKLLRLSEGYR